MTSIAKPIQPVRLYWGENYAPKPPAVVKAIQDALAECASGLHLYPSVLCEKAVSTLSSALAVTHEQILVGNGIEGLLGSIFGSFVSSGDEVVVLAPTFSGYGQNAMAVGAYIVEVPVGLMTTLSANDVLARVTPRTKMICLASPNTMTGQYHLPKAEIVDLLEQFPGLVVMDECYFGIGKMTVMPLVQTYTNLLLLRSVSKSWGLAGLRLGYAVGYESVIETIRKKYYDMAPDPVAAPSYAVFLAIWPFQTQLEQAYRLFQEAFSRQLGELDGVSVYPSLTTFLPVVTETQISLSEFIATMRGLHVFLKETASLGYLLVGVPPKEAWPYVLWAFVQSLKKGGRKEGTKKGTVMG